MNPREHTLVPPLGIWDLHAHLSGVPGRTPEERLTGLLRFADRMGVERLCVFMGMEWTYDPSPEQLRAQNDDVLAAISHWHHRASGFVYTSPAHPEASLAEIERCVTKGPMIGIKLWVARRCSDPGTDRIVEMATKLGVPVFQHTWLKITGNLPGESTPTDLAALARRHPGCTFICGHSGGDWELGIRAVRDCPNVLVDLGGGDPTAGFTEMAVRELGAARVLYGSDVGGRSFASQIAKVTGARIADKDKAAILRGNLRRLLAPLIQARGMLP